MTRTRLWSAGAESNATSSMSEFNHWDADFVVSQAKVKTGNYSFRSLNAQSSACKTIPATKQIAVALHWAGAPVLNTGYRPTPLCWLASSGCVIGELYTQFQGAFALEINGSTVAMNTIWNYSTDFCHLGLDINTDSASGWVYVYHNGTLILSASGDGGNGSAITTIEFPKKGTYAIANGAYYYDDLYIDDTTGEALPAVLPDYRFLDVTPNDPGDYNMWYGSDGDSVANHLLVSKRPHSDDDYVSFSASGVKDTYNVARPVYPTGFTVHAVIPYAYAYKDGGNPELALELYSAGSASWTSSPMALSTCAPCSMLQGYATSAPDGTLWTAASVIGLQVGMSSSGVFA